MQNCSTDSKGHSFANLLLKQIAYIVRVPFKLSLLALTSLRNNAMNAEYKQAAASWKEVNRFVARYAYDKL